MNRPFFSILFTDPHKKKNRFCLILLFLVTFLSACFEQQLPPLETIAPSGWEVEEDVVEASLGGLFFLDSQTGWIVGNKGIIIHTQDGGKSIHFSFNFTQLWP